MTFDFYKNREDVARAFDAAADAVREEKKNSGEEPVGKYVHIKRQLRRAIWEEEDSPAERFDRRRRARRGDRNKERTLFLFEGIPSRRALPAP